jgi:drug/metabolite transporter (DMT)-like permease
MSASVEKKPAASALVIAFATIYIVWGSTYLGMRVAIETMPPFAMAAARFLLAGFLLYGFVRLRGAAAPKPHQWRDATIIGTLLLLGGNGLVVWAEQYIPSGVAALIIGVSPVFFVLVEWAWPGGQRPTALTFAGLALGFAGIAWLAAPWESPARGGLHVGGMIALIVACASWSIGSIFSRHAKKPAPPFVASGLQMICGGGALALVALLRGEFSAIDFAAISGRSWAAFAFLVLVGSLVGFSTFVWLMKHSTPARVSTYAYVNPVVAVFLGWLLLDEPITARTLLAATIIVTAVVIITTQKSKKKPAPATRELALKPRRADA